MEVTSASPEGADVGQIVPNTPDGYTQPIVSTIDIGIGTEDYLAFEMDTTDEAYHDLLEEGESKEDTQATTGITTSMPIREDKPAEIYHAYLQISMLLKDETWRRQFGHYAKLTPDFADGPMPPSIVLRTQNGKGNTFDIDLYPGHSSWSPPNFAVFGYKKYPIDVILSVYEHLLVHDPETLRRLPALSGQRLGVCNLKTNVGHLLIVLFRLLVTDEMVRTYKFTERDLLDMRVNHRHKTYGEKPNLAFSIGSPDDRTPQNLCRLADRAYDGYLANLVGQKCCKDLPTVTELRELIDTAPDPYPPPPYNFDVGETSNAVSVTQTSDEERNSRSERRSRRHIDHRCRQSGSDKSRRRYSSKRHRQTNSSPREVFPSDPEEKHSNITSNTVALRAAVDVGQTAIRAAGVLGPGLRTTQDAVRKAIRHILKCRSIIALPCTTVIAGFPQREGEHLGTFKDIVCHLNMERHSERV
uniref:Uncharacterized protein n=1 Tax=Branchiostoma floridae TaxID=7739 RepID=C3ZJS5_BRAFL|eukprot:XP_002591199.1 hypothetical protein BRAFLDRAFT_105401 [Branchiostoma floridae]